MVIGYRVGKTLRVKRYAIAMLLKSINYWSYPGGLEGTLHIEPFFEMAKGHGFEAVEVGIGEIGSALGLDASEDKCRALASKAGDLGMSIPSTASGLYWGRSLGDSDATLRAKAVDDLKRMLEIAHWLGAKTHLTIPGAVDVFFLPDRKPQRYDDVIKFAAEGIAQCLPIAEAAGVRMGLENVWNRILMSPTEMSAFIDQFNSPFVGAYLDVANVLPFGYPEQWIRILKHRLVGVHFKDFRRAVGTAEGFVDLLEGDVDWPQVMMSLREVEYAGPVVAEMIPLYRHFPEVRCANCSRAMDAILGRN